MAINLNATVLTKYRADTSQHLSEVKKLEGAEQKRHKNLIAQSDKEASAMESMTSNLAKATIAVGAVTAAVAILDKGFDTLKTNARLRGATAGVDLEGLRRATNGLVDDTRLLEFASKAMTGTFKLSQAEMEGSLRGVIAFRNEGNELNKTLDNVQKALTEGTVEPLKELGHVIRGVENDTREGLNAAMQELSATALAAGPDLARPGDELSAASVRADNAMDSLQESIGRLAASLTPAVEGFASMASSLADIANSAQDLADNKYVQAAMDVVGFGGGISAAKLAQNAMKQRAAIERKAALALGPQFGPDENFSMGPEFGPFQTDAQARAANSNAPRSRGRSGGYSVTEADASDRGNFVQGYSQEQTAANFSIDGDIAAGNDALAELRALTFDIEGMQQSILATSSEAQAQFQQNNILHSIFGTPSEIDAQTQAIMVMSGAFDGLANAFGAGVEAMITGSSSFQKAFFDMIGSGLKGMAVDMSIRAFKETAHGFADLALGLPTAAVHFKSAAVYGAGAVAAGLAASQFSVNAAVRTPPSGGGGAPTGAAGVGSASPANSNEGRGSSQVFIVGESFTGRSAREREAEFREISRRAGFRVTGDVIEDG